ncbi:MAG: hypothetical protein PHV77_04915 [Candidatus Omnitrophica bacterium]|jgi:hypothetical protein|nr:hypothetical protein [Candidatus Omnitrophota bacterium]
MRKSFYGHNKFIVLCAVYIMASIISVVIIPSSILSHYTQTYCNLFLRETSLSNSGIDPYSLFEEEKPATGLKESGQAGVTTVIVHEGRVKTTDLSTGRIDDIPAGTKVQVGKSPTFLEDRDRDNIPFEFRGGPLDEVSAQSKRSGEIASSATDKFKGFSHNKAIEINVDMFPDPGAGKDAEFITRGVLDIIALKMLSFKRDSRFSGKLYVSFVSRSNDAVRLENVLAQFKGLDTVKYHELDNMLTAKIDGLRPEDKITISYREDDGLFLNPALMLVSAIANEKKVMAYPWHVLIDLAVGVLSVDRSIPLDRQQEVVDSIKAIFQDLFKGTVDAGSLDDLLNNFLSNNIEAAVTAARQLALPAITAIDYEQIEDLNRMLREVASNA